jgi:kinesin family member C1
VTDATVVPLTSPGQVKVLLGRAQKKRSVAATVCVVFSLSLSRGVFFVPFFLFLYEEDDMLMMYVQLMNERSSRSHSVFTLRISGVNVGVGAASTSTASGSTPLAGGSTSPEPGNELEGTGERCEGCLNLVDLAGSERLNVSFGPGVTEKVCISFLVVTFLSGYGIQSWRYRADT